MRVLLLLLVSLPAFCQYVPVPFTTTAGGHSFAQSFNGTNQAMNSAQSVVLTGVNTITVAFWLWENAFNNSDELSGETSTNFNSNTGAFIIDPNSGSFTGEVAFVANLGSGTSLTCHFARPSAAAWHYYVLEINSSATRTCSAWVDGTNQSATVVNTGSGSVNLTSQTMYLMSRGASSLWNAGKLAELAIWTSNLSGTDVATLWNSGGGALATSASVQPIRYWHGCDTSTDVITGSWTGTGSPSTTTGPGLINCP